MKISLKSFITANTLFQTILDLVRLKKAKMHKRFLRERQGSC